MKTIIRKEIYMEDLPVPYFFTNKEWYYYDEEEEKYKLTDKAPQEAIDSYNEFYKELEEDD